MSTFFAFSSLFLVFFFDSMTCLLKGPLISECDITILSIYLCAENTGYGNVSIDFKTINDEGTKALDLSYTLNEPFSEEFTMSQKIDAYNNGEWKENIHYYEGAICPVLSKYVPRAWANLRESLEPPPQSECASEPGNYKLRNFKAAADEVDGIPCIFGRFRTIVNVFDPADELFVCGIVESEVSPMSTF